MIVRAIKYGASWCNPCQLLEKNLEITELPFEAVDVDEHEDIADLKNITTIPVTEFYDETGNIVCTKKGYMSLEELDEIFEEYGRYF